MHASLTPVRCCPTLPVAACLPRLLILSPQMFDTAFACPRCSRQCVTMQANYQLVLPNIRDYLFYIGSGASVAGLVIGCSDVASIPGTVGKQFAWSRGLTLRALLQQFKAKGQAASL